MGGAPATRTAAEKRAAAVARRQVQREALGRRRMRKRQKALRRAALRFALERSRVAREAQAVAADKGGGGGKGVAGGAGGKGQQQENREEMCLICQCEFTVGGDSGEGIRCPGSHFMCSECTGVFVSSVLSDLEAGSWPPRCPVCRVSIPTDHFERHLDPLQQARVRAHVAEQSLKPGETIIKCGECGYYEIRTDDPVVWHCAGCQHATCLVCNKMVPPPAPATLEEKAVAEAGGGDGNGDGNGDGDGDGDDGEKEWQCESCDSMISSDLDECDLCGIPRSAASLPSKLQDQGSGGGLLGVISREDQLEGHLIGCASLRHAKKQFEDAIETGSKMSCPACGLAGRKDDACTHMTCPRCTTPWCYVCGLSVADCGKDAPDEGRPVNDLFLHNRGWERDGERCPMYLTQILEVDTNWLGQDWQATATQQDFDDDNHCLEYFHRFRTIKTLQAVRVSIGENEFASL